MSAPFEEMAELDRLVHEPARLAILTALAACRSADYLYLQRLTGLSKGNLSSHLAKLEAAELVTIEKEFVGKTPNTRLGISKAGRAAVERHWRRLERCAAPRSVDARNSLACRPVGCLRKRSAVSAPALPAPRRLIRQGVPARFREIASARSPPCGAHPNGPSRAFGSGFPTGAASTLSARRSSLYPPRPAVPRIFHKCWPRRLQPVSPPPESAMAMPMRCPPALRSCPPVHRPVARQAQITFVIVRSRPNRACWSARGCTTTSDGRRCSAPPVWCADVAMRESIVAAIATRRQRWITRRRSDGPSARVRARPRVGEDSATGHPARLRRQLGIRPWTRQDRTRLLAGEGPAAARALPRPRRLSRRGLRRTAVGGIDANKNSSRRSAPVVDTAHTHDLAQRLLADSRSTAPTSPIRSGAHHEARRRDDRGVHHQPVAGSTGAPAARATSSACVRSATAGILLIFGGVIRLRPPRPRSRRRSSTSPDMLTIAKG